MEVVKWFERRFSLPEDLEEWPAIRQRLTDAPLRLTEILASIPENRTAVSIDGTWSIRQNIGHLIDLEQLWQGRLSDIESGETYLRATDLANGMTHQADHNDHTVSALLGKFDDVRRVTMRLLQEVKPEQMLHSALHPRLHQPMTILGLFYFVAEHDDHHINRIIQLS